MGAKGTLYADVSSFRNFEHASSQKNKRRNIRKIKWSLALAIKPKRVTTDHNETFPFFAFVSKIKFVMLIRHLMFTTVNSAVCISTRHVIS